MKSTEEKTWQFWVISLAPMILICVLIYMAMDDRRDAESDRYLQTLRDKRESAQRAKINEIESRLKILKSKVKQLDAASNQLARGHNESAGNVESMSEQEHLALILKNASLSDWRILADHFKQENEFKASLSRAQKKAIRRSAETMAMTE